MWTVLDKTQSVIEYFICLIFILSGILQLFIPLPQGGSEMQTFLATEPVTYFYAVALVAIGVLFLAAKLMRRRKFHKHMLMVVYLSTIFITFLEYIILGGLSWLLVDNVIIGMLAAWFWIRWKFRTEYLDMKTIRKLRKDLNL